MDEITYLTILYDYYGELLNEKQKSYFTSYYFDNLSLSEISENMGVSRNAIHKQLKIIEKKLSEYEKALKLYKKSEELNKVIGSINDKKIKEELLKIDLL